MNKEEFQCYNTQHNQHILFFDGASKGNPGVEGNKGIIYDPKGKEKSNFVLGLWSTSNTKVEVTVTVYQVSQRLNA